MHHSKVEKTIFIIIDGIYCYNIMSLGLKNAGTMYHHMTCKIFQPMIGKIMEVYVDDMLVKSHKHKEHLKHLNESFELFRKHKLKLNPLKCAFGVQSVKFLGYLVTKWNIEVGIEQLQEILNMSSLTMKKKIQALTGWLIALNRFISRSSNKLRPFFMALKGFSSKEWTKECEQAFVTIKMHLTTPPILS